MLAAYFKPDQCWNVFLIRNNAAKAKQYSLPKLRGKTEQYDFFIFN